MIWIALSIIAIVCASILFWRVAFLHRPKMNRRLPQRSAPTRSFDWRSRHLFNKPAVPPEPESVFALEAENVESDSIEAFAPVEVTPEKSAAHSNGAKGVIVIYLVAPPHRNYRGYELLQALLAAGLRFGSAKIFHRYENKQGNGPILFNLASIQKPGTFEISRMGAHECEGLALFMTIDGSVDHLYAFELMIDTAKQLADDLGGTLFNEDHEPLTAEMISKMADEIERCAYQGQTADLFAETKPV